MTEAIRARERSSSHERCPYCHEEFALASGSEPDERVACEGCGTAHHAECFAENGGCSSLGCERAVARVQGGGSVPVGLLGERLRQGPRASSEDRFVIGAVAVVAVVLLAVVGIAVGWEKFLPIAGGVGALVALIAFGLWLLGRGTEMLPIDEDRERPVSFAPERGPIHGAEVLERLLARPVTGPVTAEDRQDPSGATSPCPTCSRPLEDASRLSFCYHCGASLR